MSKVSDDDRNHERKPKDDRNKHELPVSPLSELEWNVAAKRKIGENQHARTCKNAAENQHSGGSETKKQCDENPTDDGPNNQCEPFGPVRKSAMQLV